MKLQPIESAPKDGERVIHYLKCWPEYFREVSMGRKTFEIRRNDRDFKVGELLCCVEYDPQTERYSGFKYYFVITYITDFNQKPGFVVMGIRDLLISESKPTLDNDAELQAVKAERDSLRAALLDIIPGWDEDGTSPNCYTAGEISFGEWRRALKALNPTPEDSSVDGRAS